MQRKLSFSERNGYIKVSDIVQTKALNQQTKNDIWNYFFIIFRKLLDNGLFYQYLEKTQTLFLHKRIDELPKLHSEKIIENIIYNDTWNKLYDFIEFWHEISPTKVYGSGYRLQKNYFALEINHIFESNNVGYRMIEGYITPITDKNEIATIQQAIDNSPYSGIETHLKSALQHFSDKTSPDYRNSIKESISAVEVICRKITETSNLAEAFKKINSKGTTIPDVLKNAMSKLYDFTNGKNGIRHALMDDDKTGKAEAYYMLIACSSFINYLNTKQSEKK